MLPENVPQALEVLRCVRMYRMQIIALLDALIRYKRPAEYFPATGGYVIRRPGGAALFWSPSLVFEAALKAEFISKSVSITERGQTYLTQQRAMRHG